MIHFCIVTLGGRDLVRLCQASLKKYSGFETRWSFPSLSQWTPFDTTDHGLMLDHWRTEMKGLIRDIDLVVIMDPDCVLLVFRWRHEIDRVFKDSTIGIWGAGSTEDFGPRVHASMMVIRGELWNTLDRSFTPCTDPREQTWRDTGGLYCMFAKAAGWQLKPIERGPDWHGVSAWWSGSTPLWAHLGGGTWSDPTRMTWWQRIRRRKAIQQRRRFIAAVEEHLAQ